LGKWLSGGEIIQVTPFPLAGLIATADPKLICWDGGQPGDLVVLSWSFIQYLVPAATVE